MNLFIFATNKSSQLFVEKSHLLYYSPSHTNIKKRVFSNGTTRTWRCHGENSERLFIFKCWPVIDHSRSFPEQKTFNMRVFNNDLPLNTKKIFRAIFCCDEKSHSGHMKAVTQSVLDGTSKWSAKIAITGLDEICSLDVL